MKTIVTVRNAAPAEQPKAPAARRYGTRPQIICLALGIWSLTAGAAMWLSGIQDWREPAAWGSWTALFVLVPAFAAAEIFVVHLHLRADAHTFSLVELPLAFGLCFASPLALLGGQLAGAGAALVFHRRQTPVKLLFNAAVFASSTVAAVGVFRWLAPAHQQLGTTTLLALAVALLAEAVVSVLLVFVVISLSKGGWSLADLRSGLGFGLVTASFTASLAVVAVLVADERPGIAWMLAVPIVGTYLANWAYTTQRRRHQGLDFLYQSTQLLHRSPELEPAIVQLLRHACDTFNAEVAELVYFREAEEDPLAARVGPGEVAEFDRGLAEPLATLAGRRTSSLLAAETDDGEEAEFLADRGYRNAIVAPLLGERRVVGALVIANRLSDVMAFDANDVRLAETLAMHTTTALENGRLEQSLAQLRVLEGRLSFQALHDPLTGLANRTLFRTELSAAIERDGARGVVLFIDLDDFKTVNDSFGHAAGDDLLVEVATRLQRCVGEGDTIARLGGDEFAVLLADTACPLEAEKVAERILHEFDEPVAVAHRRMGVRASIGIAPIEPDADPESVMRSADTAMYTAKAQGKHRVVAFEPAMYESSLHRFNLHSDLQRAIAASELTVHYQPIVRLDTHDLLGVEALVRWHHPRLGLLAPDSFLALAEETGLVATIDTIVLRDACRWLALVDAHHPGLIPFVNVNLSPRSVQDARLADSIATVLEGCGLAPSRLGIEITENLMSEEADRAVETLQQLKAAGLRLSLDDFGTGYSSLSHLQSLPVDVVKIAKPFIDDIESSESQRAFATAIIALGRALDKHIVAEGIERPEQLELLERLGCDAGQGHYFARAMAGDAVVAWARHWADPRDPALVAALSRAIAGR